MRRATSDLGAKFHGLRVPASGTRLARLRPNPRGGRLEPNASICRARHAPDADRRRARPGRRDRRRRRPRHRRLRRRRSPACGSTATRVATGAVRETTTDAERQLRAHEPRAGRVPRRVRGRGLQPAGRSTTRWCRSARGSASTPCSTCRARAETVEVRGAGRGGADGQRRSWAASSGRASSRTCRSTAATSWSSRFLLAGQRPGAELRPHEDEHASAISSAGQLGRGGNITIDGQDNNDDVVGGPLANLPQDAVQEFQIATNRFSAEQGRSAASAVNVVTQQRHATRCAGSLSVFLRDDALQGLPATFDRSTGEAPPFDREQYSATLGGPIARGKAWWFARGRVPQPGRGRAGRRARRRHAHDPPDASPRRRSTTSWPRRASTCARRDKDTLGFRYLVRGRRATPAAEHARPLDRLRLASARRATTATSRASRPGRASLGADGASTRCARATATTENAIDPVDARPPAHVPEHPGRRELPRAAGHHADALAGHRLAVAGCRGAHTLRVGGEVSRTYGALRPRASSATGASSWCRTSPQFDLNRDGRVDDNDLLFAVTLRSGKPDQNLRARRLQQHATSRASCRTTGALTPQLTLNARPALRARHERQEHLGLRRHQPDRAALPAGRPQARLRQLRPARRLRVAEPAAARFQLHGGYGLYYDRVTLEIISLERGLDGRALPIEVRAGQRVLPRSRRRARVPPFAPTFADPFTGFILPGAGRLGHQHHRQHAREPDRPAVQPRARASRLPGRRRCCSSTSSTTAARTSSSAGRSARCSTPWWAAPTAS